MSEIKRVLFPVDLSEVSPMLAPRIKELTGKLGAKLYVLFVARALDHYGIMGVPYAYTREFEEELIRKAEVRLAEFMEKHFAGFDAEAGVARGYPAEEILRFAYEKGIDLITMGTHGRKGLEKIIFGSVAEHVVKNSSIPVLTINPYRNSPGRTKLNEGPEQYREVL